MIRYFSTIQFVPNDVDSVYKPRSMADKVCGEPISISDLESYRQIYDFAVLFHSRPTCVREIGMSFITCLI